MRIGPTCLTLQSVVTAVSETIKKDLLDHAHSILKESPGGWVPESTLSHEPSGNVARAMIRRSEVFADYLNFMLASAKISLLIISSDPSREFLVMDGQH